MIEHAEDTSVARVDRHRRPTLAKTLCGRWVDHMRIAVRPESVSCRQCLARGAQFGREVDRG